MERPLTEKSHGQQGVALVILLAFIVLLSGVVVAFLSRAMVTRRLSNGSLNRTKAEQLALSAAEIIIGDLKQEIDNGSTKSSMGAGATIYRPKAPVNVLPARKAPDEIQNLVRRSGDDPPFPAVSSRASSVRSTAASMNGRSVSAARWNSHYLIPRPPGAAPTDTEPIPAFLPPAWVMITSNEGSIQNPPNLNRVIGRYAYAIYDEGGLLDANVAGYPANSSIEQFAGKPALAYADLRELGNGELSDTLINALVGWRNYATARPGGSFGDFTFNSASAKDYFDAVINNTNGFLQANAVTWNGRTDQAFLSRQLLIDYALNAQWGPAVNSLQYLGTFSRDINAPSWSPPIPTSTNPDLLTVRVTKEFKRPDGTTARIGKPLLKRRFPLSRLAGLGSNGILADRNSTLLNGISAPASATTIQRDFGLVWNGDHWAYCGPTGKTALNSIATIRQFGNREPNFFELLKAALQDSPSDPQIIRIGANIIDQYDADSYPTEIRFGKSNSAYYGKENVPYAYAEFLDDGGISARVWNPHQILGKPSTPPTKFRLRATTEPESAVYLNIGDLPSDYPIDDREWILEYQPPSAIDKYREYHRINLTVEKAPDPRTDRLSKELSSKENANQEPSILNRPFRNVGELGYVFRESPWKNIDFFGEHEGSDAGLLDIFCVNETTDEQALVAGKISLNTRQATVLQAVLTGAMVIEAVSSVLRPNDAGVIADKIVAFTTGIDSLPNRSELASILKVQEKSKGEAALRALSEVGTTRTWNLLIDVIAQTGHYGPAQKDPTNFIVEGENRYWVHVAIDRFTAEVVDKIVEAVHE